MSSESACFLEATSLSSLIAAADVVLKSADVSDLQIINLGKGNFTLYITGDSSSVEAGKIAGEESIKKNGGFLRSQSIPQLDSRIEKFISEVKQ